MFIKSPPGRTRVKRNFNVSRSFFTNVAPHGPTRSDQHLYEHTEHTQCVEVTHSPEADFVAFHILPAVAMSCRLFPSEAVEKPAPVSSPVEF